MTRLRSVGLFFVVLFAVASSQVAAPVATPDKAKAQALYDLSNEPAVADFGYSTYNIQKLVRAIGMAYEYYDSIDTATNLPANIRAVGPTLAAGDKLRRADKADEAIAAYRRATAGPIDTAKLARSYLGQALVFAKTTDQRPKAVQLLRQVLRFTPDNADASLALALNYCFLLDWENALQVAQQTIRMKPNDPRPRYWLAWIYFHGLGDNENAMAAYQEELRLKPADDHALTDLGIAYLYTRQYANAVTASNEPYV